MFGISRIPLTGVKRKKIKGEPKSFFFNPPFPLTKKSLLQKSHIFLCLSDSQEKKFKKLKAMPIL